MLKDYSSYKYIIAKELGEPLDNIFGKYSDKDKSIHWFTRSHIESDGVAAFTDLMKAEGIQITNVHLAKKYKIPNALKRFQLLLKHMKASKGHDYPWKSYDESKRGTGAGLGYAVFSKEETTQLFKFCREGNVTFTSLALHCLDKVTTDYFFSQPSERSWFLPVNIRDMVTIKKFGNFTSSLPLHLPLESTIQDVHNQIQELYREGIHWGGWTFSTFPKYIGLSGLRFMIKHLYKRSPYMGVFSNMGNINPPVSEGNSAEYIRYFSVPPVSIMGPPISTGSVSWRGCLTLTMLIHPSLSEDITVCKEVIQQWIDEIFKTAKVAPKDIVIGVDSKDKYYEQAVKF